MKTRFFVSGITLSLVGLVVFLMGVVSFLEIQATEERLESMIKAGSSTPLVTYDQAWMYFGTSAIFFGIGGFFLIWRKRK